MSVLWRNTPPYKPKKIAKRYNSNHCPNHLSNRAEWKQSNRIILMLHNHLSRVLEYFNASVLETDANNHDTLKPLIGVCYNTFYLQKHVIHIDTVLPHI